MFNNWQKKKKKKQVSDGGKSSYSRQEPPVDSGAVPGGRGCADAASASIASARCQDSGTAEGTRSRTGVCVCAHVCSRVTGNLPKGSTC